MIELLADAAAPVIPVGAQAALNNIAFINDMVTDMQNVGTAYGTQSLLLGGALFASLSAYRLVSGAREYAYTHAGSYHGCEQGIMSAARKLFTYFIVMGAVGTMMTAGLYVLAQTVLAQITGVVIVGPTSLLALGATTMLKLVQQPLNMVIAALPPQTVLPFGLTAPAQAVQMAQNWQLLAIGAVLTVIAILISLFIIAPCFAWITVQYIAALVEIAVVLPLREFEMGWAAAPGTEPWSAEFYGDVRRGFISLLVIGMLAAFIGATVGLWANETAIPPGGQINILVIVQTWFKVSLGSIVFLGLSIALPKMVHGRPAAIGARDIMPKIGP